MLPRPPLLLLQSLLPLYLARPLHQEEDEAAAEV
jgi:hypothetical protein